MANVTLAGERTTTHSTQITELLAFARQQRKIVGDMECTLANAISGLIEAAYIERELMAGEHPALRRGFKEKKNQVAGIMIDYNEEARRLCESLQAYYEHGLIAEPQTKAW